MHYTQKIKGHSAGDSYKVSLLSWLKIISSKFLLGQPNEIHCLLSPFLTYLACDTKIQSSTRLCLKKGWVCTKSRTIGLISWTVLTVWCPGLQFLCILASINLSWLERVKVNRGTGFCRIFATRKLQTIWNCYDRAVLLWSRPIVLDTTSSKGLGSSKFCCKDSAKPCIERRCFFVKNQHTRYRLIFKFHLLEWDLDIVH